MKFPDDVEQTLKRRFKSRHRAWLKASGEPQRQEKGAWPLEIPLGIPSENQALKQIEDVRAWVVAWQSWNGAGSLCWNERRWRTLGTQPVPEKLSLSGPDEVAQWVGEIDRWDRAQQRYQALIGRWPQLDDRLSHYFAMLADYSTADYQRLVDMLSWLEKHPATRLYPRQLPVRGLNSKWFEQRKALLADLVDAVCGRATSEGDCYRRCGLKAPPQLIRMRILDNKLRQRIGGLSDIATPREQLAELDLPVDTVFIVENLQTGLSFDDMSGSIVIMQLGYGVDVLGHLPWIARAHCVYWGDLDTHGFAILSRARSYLPGLKSVLMDEVTLRSHEVLWVEEKDQHAAETLPLLSDSEQAVYQVIKHNVWGQNIRLEQERIAWDVAWKTLQQAI